MTVTTNSFGGYAVTVQAASDTMDPAAPGISDRIPIALLGVRENGTSDLLAPVAPIIHVRPSTSRAFAARTAMRSATTTRSRFPSSRRTRYSTTLEYIATAQ